MSVIKSYFPKQSVEISFNDISELTTATNTILVKPVYRKTLYFRFLSDNHGIISRYNSALNNTPEGAWKSANFGMTRFWDDAGTGARWTIAPILNPPNGIMNEDDYIPVANYTALLALPVEGLDQQTFYLTLDNNRMYRWRASDNTFLYLFEPLTDLITLTQNVAQQNGDDIATINDFLNQTVPIGGFTVGTNDLPTLLNAKANQTTTYTKTEADTLLNAKANQTTTYTKTETNTLLDAKANQTTAQQNSDDIQAINDFLNQVDLGGGIVDLATQLNAKANQTTTYTKDQVVALLGAKLSKSGGIMTGNIEAGGTVSLLNFTNITTSGIYCQNLVSNGGAPSVSMTIGDTITTLQKPIDINNKALTNVPSVNGKSVGVGLHVFRGEIAVTTGTNDWDYTCTSGYSVFSVEWCFKVSGSETWQTVGVDRYLGGNTFRNYCSCHKTGLVTGDTVQYRILAIKDTDI